MATQVPGCCDNKWDLWRKILQNQVEQGSTIGLGSEMQGPQATDSIYDLMRKFLVNQALQG